MILDNSTAAVTLLARIGANLATLKLVGEAADDCAQAKDELNEGGNVRAAQQALKAQLEFDKLFKDLMDTVRADMATYDAMQPSVTLEAKE